VRRVLLRSLAVVIILAATIWAIGALRQHLVLGTVAGEDRLTVTVDEGDRFTVAVPDRGGSIGDHWTVSASPSGIVEPIEERNVPSSWWERLFGRDSDLAGGGDGTTYFVYEATQRGEVAVIAANCYRGCDQPSPESRSVTWMITVR
jgi:inhibitor of cysteine peptidase